MEPLSITCPKCGMTSYNPNDVVQGYCGHCHEFTSSPAGVLPIPDKPHEHDWVYKEDEYDSLANGGSYEVYSCSGCARLKYVQLPD